MNKIIHKINHELTQKLISKTNRWDEWYAHGVKQSKHDLSAWGFEKDYK